jgi:hypothetical protein
MGGDSDWIGVIGLAVGGVSLAYAVVSDIRRRSQREWVHMALVNLKPSIRGENKSDVVRAIDNMLSFLKPPPPPPHKGRDRGI